MKHTYTYNFMFAIYNKFRTVVYESVYSMLSGLFQCWNVFHSLWLSDAFWWHRTGWPMAQFIACRLMESSHCLNQCWLIIRCVLWHSYEREFTGIVHEFTPQYVFGDYTFKITLTSLQDQWLNPYSTGTKLIWFYIVNIMVADALASGVARTSAPMMLTM